MNQPLTPSRRSPRDRASRSQTPLVVAALLLSALSACGDDTSATGAGGTAAQGGAGGAGAAGGDGAGTTQTTGGSGGVGGESCSPACGNGLACEAASDCASGRCEAQDGGSVCSACLSDADCAGSGALWHCDAGACTDAGAKSPGFACDAGSDCASGFCVDGLCCDTACGGGASDDCLACSVAAGAQADGVCGPRASGASCGDPADSACDAADSCDGAGTCEARIAPAGASCTVDGLFCTGVESCDGQGSCVEPGSPCSATELCDEVATACRANIWFNEIHYDNADPDTLEGLELAGRAGIDLSGWGFLFYDGASGAAFAYIGPLGGTLVDEANGFGTMALPIDGMPEGNIGIALLDANFSVVQFVSYGGAFTAADDIAAGMMSVDVGLSESEATSAGSSLQLTGGPGAQYSDFTWTQAAQTLGAVNAGQSF